MTTRSSYDEVLYPARPFEQTHPDRLATIATLLGLSPAPPSRARVLELGCGAGGNLLPMAARMPDARFVGVDSASEPIARARDVAARAGLTNVSFLEAGLEDYDAEAGSVDYVIAHGVYSWVPDAVRAALLALCGRLLADHGVAYVSYNALPGGRLRGMLREALDVHLAGIDGARERIAATRQLLALLIAAADSDDELAPTLGRAAREVADRDDAFLFHDVIASDNRAFGIGEFAADAGVHGLAYLSEAQYSETQLGALAPALQHALGAIGDPVRREQYLDMLKERRFRQTLLCRAEHEPDRAVGPDRLRGLHASAALEVEHADGQTTFRGPGTAKVVTSHPLLVRVLGELAGAWPAPLAIGELGSSAEQPEIRTALLRCYSANLVRLHVAPPAVARVAPLRPRVSALSRFEAADGLALTTVRHTHVAVEDPLVRRVAALLDGTRDRATLAGELNAGEHEVGSALERLASAGLLEPADRLRHGHEL